MMIKYDRHPPLSHFQSISQCMAFCAQYVSVHAAPLAPLFLYIVPDIWHVNQIPINDLKSTEE